MARKLRLKQFYKVVELTIDPDTGDELYFNIYTGEASSMKPFLLKDNDYNPMDAYDICDEMEWQKRMARSMKMEKLLDWIEYFDPEDRIYFYRNDVLRYTTEEPPEEWLDEKDAKPWEPPQEKPRRYPRSEIQVFLLILNTTLIG